MNLLFKTLLSYLVGGLKMGFGWFQILFVNKSLTDF